ncbi:hypothetical protein MTO96_003511 [Rhipicephalus appendiculatus]
MGGNRHRQGPAGAACPGYPDLALRAARRRAERQALSKAQPELWRVFRRVDGVCRLHASRRRKKGWVSVCLSIDRSRDGTRVWRLLKCLLMVPRDFKQVLSLAVHLSIQVADLAEQLADQFAARDIAQLPAAPPPAALQCPASCHHPGWIAAQVQELCSEPMGMHELEAALEGSKRRSAPGADGITFQMLCNLDGADRQRLLENIFIAFLLSELLSQTTAMTLYPISSKRKITFFSMA